MAETNPDPTPDRNTGADHSTKRQRTEDTGDMPNAGLLSDERSGHRGSSEPDTLEVASRAWVQELQQQQAQWQQRCEHLLKHGGVKVKPVACASLPGFNSLQKHCHCARLVLVAHACALHVCCAAFSRRKLFSCMVFFAYWSWEPCTFCMGTFDQKVVTSCVPMTCTSPRVTRHHNIILLARSFRAVQ